MSWYVCGTFFYIDPAVLYTFQQEVWIHFPEQTEHHQLQSLDKHSPDMQFPSCWSGIMTSSNYTRNKTGVERRQTLGPLRSINPNMINHFIKQSLLRCQRWRDCQKDVSHLLGWLSLVVDIHGSVAFSKLPSDIENLSRLSKHTLSMISIS